MPAVCSGMQGTWMNPARTPGPAWCSTQYSRWLHTYVPALLDSSDGTPASRMARTMSFTGTVAKYAAGPPGTMGASAGCYPALSGIRASSTLMATRSGATALRPAA